MDTKNHCDDFAMTEVDLMETNEVVSMRSRKENNLDGETNHPSVLWDLMGRRLPRSEIVFFSQMTLVVIVIIASVYNLSVNSEDHTLWTALLSSCLGYVLPNPSLQSSRSLP